MSIRVVDPTCVRCGKPLTDPASRALRIGPECRRGMNAVQLRDAAAKAAEQDDPFRIPVQRAPSVQARVNNHNARTIAQPEGVQLCHHENRAGACPDCRREADPWRASEVILREVRGWSFTERRVERARVLAARYAHVAPWTRPEWLRAPRTRPTPTPRYPRASHAPHRTAGATVSDPGYSVSCGASAGRRTGPHLTVELTRYRCPWCRGTGRWTSGERCMECVGAGVTDSPKPGVDLSTPGDGAVPDIPDAEAVPLPRPPAVMRSPCVDCAYRPGSPEEDTTARPDASQPFFCHHGMHRVGDGYQAAAWVGGMPLGYMVCAGWWAVATGEAGPERPFRDPGGADRSESTP